LSEDQRTNRWRVTLSCNHPFVPMTTMFAEQFVECSKCGKQAFVNYNDIKIDENV
jgi:hypothetical protein